MRHQIGIFLKRSEEHWTRDTRLWCFSFKRSILSEDATVGFTDQSLVGVCIGVIEIDIVCRPFSLLINE